MIEPRYTFPSLRCRMGNWWYYITYMKFADVAHWIKPTDQIHPVEMLRDMIQRALLPNVNQIVEYLLGQDERFFNSIVVGVYEGAPQWYPIDIGESVVLGEPDLDEDSRSAIGLLKLNGEEKLFAIDGQHRVEAIKKSLKENPDLSNEDLSVIFVAHSTYSQGQERTRRLFSTLNKTAKAVSKGEIIALDEDDAFAIVTRRLVEEYELLRWASVNETRFVAFTKQPELRPADNQNLTSIITLYDITYILYVSLNSKSASKHGKYLKLRRPTNDILDEIYKQQTEYWELLKKYIPEYQELFASLPTEEIAGKYRGNGGHLMFRPIGQKAFATAVRVLMDRNWSMEDAVRALSAVPMDLGEQPWRHVLWNPSTVRVNSKVSSLLPESLFLYYVGEPPRKKKYSLLDEYRKTVDDQSVDLPPRDNTIALNPSRLPFTY